MRYGSSRIALYPGPPSSGNQEIIMIARLPAMRGTIGQRIYYSTLMKLKVLPKMFTFTDWREFSPKDREQRTLNKKRIPVIARYMTENEEGYLFASSTPRTSVTASSSTRATRTRTSAPSRSTSTMRPSSSTTGSTALRPSVKR
jgi:hypothetical protein